MGIHVCGVKVYGRQGQQRFKDFMERRAFPKGQIRGVDWIVHCDNEPYLKRAIEGIQLSLGKGIITSPLSLSTIIQNLPSGISRLSIFSMENGQTHLALFVDPKKDFTQRISSWDGTSLVAFAPPSILSGVPVELGTSWKDLTREWGRTALGPGSESTILNGFSPQNIGIDPFNKGSGNYWISPAPTLDALD